MVSLTGQSIGRYHILEQLGEGGMATVYKAYDTRLERNVAFKVLRTDLFGQAVLEQVLQRFEREAKSLAKLKHPNIVNILDYGDHEGMPYLVMEYLPGGTLKQKLGQALFWRAAIQLLLPVARGLSYAHQHGVIHRDVKPANILIDQNEEPILTDFGIAKLLEGTDGHTLTGSGVGIGTPEYMAPEQGIGARAIDARADIYSLGIVLYEMVTGRKPYIADTPMAVVLKQMTDPLPHPAEFVSDLPESVEHILLKALAKDPNDRYPDMHALIAAMENALAETIKTEAPITEAVAGSPQVVNLPTVATPVPVMATLTGPVEEKTKPRTKPSPKMIVVVVGALVIIMLVVFGAPWISEQLSTLPAAKATSTRTLTIQPTATVTAVPPSATPKPSSTLTRPSQPTITSTPVPAWITDFANPILTYIASRPPNYEDDFEPSSNAWHLYNYCADWRLKFEDGKIYIAECGAEYQGVTFNDYVVDITVSLVNNNARAELGFRNLCVFHVEIGSVRAGCGFVRNGDVTGPNVQKEYDFSDSNTVQLRLIAKGGHFAFYVNGEPLGYFEEDALRYGQQLEISAGTPGDGSVRGTDISGAFDDFKIWDITDLVIP